MYYKIITPTTTFNCIITKTDILIGGSDYSCLEISRTSLNTLDYRADSRKSHCYIYNKNNNIDSKELIKAGVFVLKYLDPDKCFLTLSDSSDKNGISMAYSNIFFYQKTWYEKHFKAVFNKKTDQIIYNDYINKFKSINMKNETFLSSLLIDILKSYNTKYIKHILELYNESISIQDFASKIKQEYKDDKYNAIKDWLHPFMNKIGFEIVKQNKWIIECINVNTDGYSLIESEPFNKLKFISKAPFINQTGSGCKCKLNSNLKDALKNPNSYLWELINTDRILINKKKDKRYLKALDKKNRTIKYL